ncbi:MAG: type III-B CRISPR module RAMP protein Cmr6, partial [Sulfurimonas sp.]|nr:type III-B CRISPR module RAMP protein Cmr6 [Sulfurimonas sp.]
MSSANIGWLFYKDYFKGIDYTNLDNANNETIINKKIANIISQTPTIEEAEVLGSTRFTATTTYPGLLLGSGNAHEIPSVKGQAILGFHFDYTSGLPVIQGSSIKGVLRSAFKHEEYIKEILNKEDIVGLESEIFDNGDVFFDATISKAENKILGDDYITPHSDELKNPIPLRFIKVLPDVSFRFDFELKDGIITKEEKIKLFENILEDLGLGAKTNVGYGKFKDFETHTTQEEQEQAKKKAEEKKAKDEADRLQAIEDTKTAKKQKAKDGINSLLECKTLPEAF